MYIRNSEYLSKFTGAEIDEAVEHIQDVEFEFEKKVDKTQKINGKELTGDITLTPEDIGAPSLDEIGNASIVFKQGSNIVGTITANQTEDATIDFAAGGGGGSISTLSDVTLESLENGQTLVYNSQEEIWKNGNTTSVEFVDWTGDIPPEPTV